MNLQRSNSLGAVTSGTPLARLAFDGYNGASYSASAAMVQAVASENFSASANGTDLAFHTTPNGSATPVERLRISNTGNIGVGTSAPAVTLDLGARTDAIALPKGTTPQQPTGAPGLIRYNTSNNAVEFYNGTSWTTLQSGGPSLSTSGGTLSGNLTIASGGLTVSAGTAFFNSGINNNSAGITNAGSLTGVGPNINATGALSIAAGGSAQNLSLMASTTGSVNIGSGNGTSLQVLDGGASTVNYVVAKGSASGGSPGIGADGSDANINLTLTPKGTGSTIIQSGRLGVGTSNPGAMVDIVGSSNIESLRIKAAGAQTQNLTSWVNSAGSVVASVGVAGTLNAANANLTSGISVTGGTSSFSGNVGIGTTAPVARLHIESPTSTVLVKGTQAAGGWGGLEAANDAGDRLTATVFGSSTSGTRYGLNMTGLAVVETNPASALAVGTAQGAPLVLGTNNIERMRISSTGDVGIGTTNPVGILDVNPPPEGSGPGRSINLIAQSSTAAS